MKLSAELLTQFAKITNDNKKVDKSSTTYGTAREIDGVMYVQMDGSELLTPASATTDMKDGDRVTITIKDHTAIATGNISSPAARKDDVQEIDSKVDTVNSDISTINSNITTIDSKIRTQDSTISTIDSTVKTHDSDISTLKSTVETQGSTMSTIDSAVKTHNSDISTLKSTVNTQESSITTINSTLETHDSSISNIKTKVDNHGSSIANIQSSIDTQNSNISAINSSIDVVNSAFKIENNEITGLSKVVTDTLVADEAFVGSLIAKDIVTDTLKSDFIQVGFTNIGVAEVEKLFADSGMIKNLVMDNGNVTGELTGVTINGELINAGTLKANRIIIGDEDGLLYEINKKKLTDAGLTIPTDIEKICSGLDGAIINDKTLTVDKVRVTDLYAFGATIGGFSITDSAIHSNLKPNADDPAPGIYLDNEGQMSIGDSDNYIKYYNDEQITRYLVSYNSETGEYIKGEVITDVQPGDIVEGVLTTDNDLVYLGTMSGESVHYCEDKIFTRKLDITADSFSLKTGSETLEDTINKLKVSIETINNTLSTLVVDENGKSLMTQDGSGWSFSIQDLMTDIDSSKESATSDSNKYTDDVASSLGSDVDYIKQKISFIDFKTIDGKPCIELSVKNSDGTESGYKLRLVNDEIKFMDGEVAPASITNEKLKIEKADIENELRFGNFVWAKHGNGNMGLMWKQEV